MSKLLLFFALLACAEAARDFYCGTQTCYEVLGIDRTAAASDVRRAYRVLSLQLHPDRNSAPDAAQQFQLLVTAYEVLKEEESRASYDDMLQHPEQYYRNMYNYYRYRSMRINLGPVVLTLIAIISVLQYLHWVSSHSRHLNYALQDPKLRQRAAREAEEDGLFKGKPTKSEKEEIITAVVRQNVVLKGALGPADWRDVLAVRLLISPYTLSVYVGWYVHWIYRHHITHQPYTHDDLVYLICRNFKMPLARFEVFDEALKSELFDYATWDPENVKEYEAMKKEEQMEKNRDSGKYKKYKRSLKKGPTAYRNDVE